MITMSKAAIEQPLIVGTAGHIDHGKSTLIQALTGTDPDRLAEEKRRGITIELGFARLPLSDDSYMGVVDVPGHERFVRQMIAGATGIDLALLCIAADDGVMPQTREHAAVLQLLGITNCIIALTKCDLVDEEWIGLVTEEIRADLKGTPFSTAPIIPVSARTGAGLNNLKLALADAAKDLRSASKAGPVRLPIDRVFTIKGAGTVITGTLWQGSVKPGDELEILPSGVLARVRTVQIHGKEVEESFAGNRTALNLVGVKTEDLDPGDFLATPSSLKATDRFDAQFTYLPTGQAKAKSLKSGSRVHVAHGTREVTGRLLLMDGTEELAPGCTAFAQVRLDMPLPTSRGDHFIIRSFSPVHVIGGGTILNSAVHHRTNLKDEDRALLAALAENDDLAICHAIIDSCDTPVSTREMARISNLPQKHIEKLLKKDIEQSKRSPYLAIGENDALWTKRQTVQKHLMAFENILVAFHAQNPEATGLSKNALRQHLGHHVADECFDALLREAANAGKLVLEGNEVSHPSAGAGARNLEKQAADALYAVLASHGTTPPALTDAFAEAGLADAAGKKAVLVLEKEGRGVRIDKTYCFAAEAFETLRAAVVAYLEKHGSATATQLKDAMKTSRKYAIPFLEYLDEKRITKRSGDERTLMR